MNQNELRFISLAFKSWQACFNPKKVVVWCYLYSVWVLFCLFLFIVELRLELSCHAEMACKANKSSCSGRSSKSLIKWINSKAGNQLEMDALRLSSQLEKGGSSGVEGTNSTNMQNSHLHLHSWYVPILFNLLASFFALLWSPAFIVMRIVLLRRSAFGFLKCHLEICLKVALQEFL